MLAPTPCTHMAPAKAIPGNPWYYRKGKGLLGAPWERWSCRDRVLWHLTPLGCAPSTSVHPWGSASSFPLPQGASGACFLVKPFGISFWRNWVLLHEVTKGYGSSYLSVSAPDFFIERLEANVLSRACLAEHGRDLRPSAGWAPSSAPREHPAAGALVLLAWKEKGGGGHGS